MFRSKKKKVGGGRKRREADDEGESEVRNQNVNAVASAATEDVASIASETVEIDLDQLRRPRSRAATGAMMFSSKSTARLSSSKKNATLSSTLEFEDTNLLSFDDENETKLKKRKMRPNLVATSAADDDIEVDTSANYTAELLETLKSEQSVVSSSKKETEDVMEVEEGNDDGVKILVQEEEEFISLESCKKKKQYAKNRVTFGVQAEGVSISKTTEVVEDISDGEDEDGDQSKRWEEELMRRGGHRVSQPSNSNGSHSRDGIQTYPTRRKVTCLSLESVIQTLEKSIESTTCENVRASRELARLEAETVLIEKTLKQQEKDLVTSSQEFEYFQEVENFVKSLSFCLRAKIPIIKEKEKKIVQDRVQRMKDRHHKFMLGVVQEVKYYLRAAKLQVDDILNLNDLDLQSKEDTTVVSSVDSAEHAVRLQKFQQHFTESYVAHSHPEEEDCFADVVDEINSIDRVYERFQQWKVKFPQVYKDVYCDLALENLLAPYVQAEMLYWDPLSVATPQSNLDKSWSLSDFAWFRLLHQRLPELENGGRDTGNVSGLILYQIRHVLVEKVRVAISRYFDPYSSLQVRSVSLMLEEIHRHGYSAFVEAELETAVSTALDTFLDEAKRTILVAIDQNTLNQDVNVFGRYLLERFSALQDNLLTLFVALPKGPIAAKGFRCLIQVFHHLLTYVRFCKETKKTKLVTTATQVIQELTSSSYVLQVLPDPCHECELKHMIEQFQPYLHTNK
ncbi:hypothetical protein PsorP6_004596 [Peronosclerospora sorghi]|uniref:Uncharacterized protein n=1 Tax=Peronosclerospora sorghi TaxID=230839 RepID=A0ACC0VLN1_9STRA|nr:hypothetical protein PsorP6_004596 [Peronosclerospora sorghi]